MNNFKKIFESNALQFIEDEFTKYKNTLQVSPDLEINIELWLKIQSTFIEDEFIKEAVEQIVESYKSETASEVGINFKYFGKDYSIYTINGNFYFTSNLKITDEKINKIIGT